MFLCLLFLHVISNEACSTITSEQLFTSGDATLYCLPIQLLYTPCWRNLFFSPIFGHTWPTQMFKGDWLSRGNKSPLTGGASKCEACKRVRCATEWKNEQHVQTPWFLTAWLQGSYVWQVRQIINRLLCIFKRPLYEIYEN